jgi:hut operon positive regulator
VPAVDTAERGGRVDAPEPKLYPGVRPRQESGEAVQASSCFWRRAVPQNRRASSVDDRAVEVRPNTLGRVALLSVLSESAEAPLAAAPLFRVVVGQVGTMDAHRVIAAIETAARREGLINPGYAEEHALYHAILEALHGVGRGQLAFGNLLRTVALRFAIARGPRLPGDDTEWLAVALYGTIGQPVKGNEHEVVGLGISHL